MPKEREIYRAYKEGIHRASLIRKDLSEHPAEYYPEKVRGLLGAYFETVRELIKQGEKYVDLTTDFEAGLEVVIALENYRALMKTLRP